MGQRQPRIDQSGLQSISSYEQPYATEIEQFTYPATALVVSKPIPFTPPADSEAIFVDTEEAVHEMLTELKTAKEIAIDLEHHDAHSYIGIACLMQISTRNKDWIVDTLKPWRENLQILNEVFADPKIVKVLHGSHEDMIWLQRDLGLYVVGLFDTYHASVALSFPGRGLKYLLKRFANFDADKKYQLADWRSRPLPSELLDYARSDTHYLLYIYDNLRNMLIQGSSSGNDLMKYVLDESKKEALQRYERPFYDSETGQGQNGWYSLLARRNIKFNAEQLAIYRAVHKWRDQLARDQDEGLGQILSAANLFKIAESMPVSVPSLMTLMRPVPRAIAGNSKALVELIKKAKDDGKAGPSVMEILNRCHDKAEAEGLIKKPQHFRYPREFARSRHEMGVGATVQMLLNERSIVPLVERAPTSSLWGTVLAATVTAEPPLPSVAAQALLMILPLPAKKELSVTYAQDSLKLDSERDQHLGTSSSASAATPTGSTPSAQAEDDTFVIRKKTRTLGPGAAIADTNHVFSSPAQLRSSTNGTSRELASKTSMPPVTAAEIDAELAAQRREERQLKKEQKRAAEQARIDALNQVRPFDYENAESMINAATAEGEEKGKGVKRPLELYKKALNTGTGVKRKKTEEGGRSFTFKK